MELTFGISTARLEARLDALDTILRGGVPVEGDREEDEIRARTVYDWLAKEKARAEALLAEARRDVE